MSALDTARLMVQNFRGTDPRHLHDPSPQGWPITRDLLARALLERIEPNQPRNSPDQGRTSRCGPAAFLYCLIHDRPDLYVKLAIELWRDGTSNLKNGKNGHDFVMHCGPTSRVVTSTLQAQSTYQVTSLDWMTLGCLSKPDGSAEPGQELQAITFPRDLGDWFLAAGCTADVASFDSVGGTTWLGDLDVFDLQKGLRLFRDHWIVLEIEPRLIAGQPGGLFERHWVVVNEQVEPTFGGTALAAMGHFQNRDALKHLPISMQLACWGTRTNPIRPNLTFEEFSHDWFGIAAFTRIP